MPVAERHEEKHYARKTTFSDAQTQGIAIGMGAKAPEDRHEDVNIH